MGLRSEHEVERKQEELEHRIQRRLQEAEQEREVEVRKMMQQQLASATQRNVDMWAGQEMEHRFRMGQLEREAKTAQLAKVNRENRALEKEVHDLMGHCQRSKVSNTCVSAFSLSLCVQKDSLHISFLYADFRSFVCTEGFSSYFLSLC